DPARRARAAGLARAARRAVAAVAAGRLYRRGAGLGLRFDGARQELEHGGRAAALPAAGPVCLPRDPRRAPPAGAVRGGGLRAGVVGAGRVDTGAHRLEPGWACRGRASLRHLRREEPQARPDAGGAVAVRVVGGAAALGAARTGGRLPAAAGAGAACGIARGVAVLRAGGVGLRLARGTLVAPFRVV